MPHTDIIYDSDPHFTISEITRHITNASSSKTAIVQRDHKSERFSFEMPKIVEGHDMRECNRVEVHYINTGNNGEVTKDIYDVDDVHVSPDDADKIVFSWLLWDNATKHEGKLAFAIRFACVADGIVEYEWNTAPFTKISILKGINNSAEITDDEEIPDLIAQWKETLFAEHEEMKAQIAAFDKTKCKAVKVGKTSVIINDHTRAAQKIKVSIEDSKGYYAEVYVYDKEGNEVYFSEYHPDTNHVTMDIPETESFEVVVIPEYHDIECTVVVEYEKYLTETHAVEGSWVDSRINSAMSGIETALDNIIEIQNNLMGVSE